jgi:hypothetical protein
MAHDMPWPLQERFSKSLAALKTEDIEQIDAMLKRLVQMMEAPPMPVWAFGPSEAVAPDEINAPE